MTISIGDKLPNARFLHMGNEGPEELELGALTEGKTVLIFAVPGAFTPTCTKSHLPGYVNNAPAFYAKGVDAIYCVTVNDVFVANAWGDMLGAQIQDIRILADAHGDFTKALGMDFDAPPAGLYGRSKRYAMVVKDGVVTNFEVEDNPGVCQLSSAEHLLEEL